MLKAVIIDDEQDAIQTIELIINDFCPNVTIVGKASSAKEGIIEIENAKPDIVFLDIAMPHFSGFDLLEKIQNREFEVIFITAYNQHAIKAFKYSAVNYILKPVDIPEFIKAVKRVEERKNKFENFKILFENIQSPLPGKLALPTLNGIDYVNINDIIRIEADRSYSTVFLKYNEQLTITKSLMELERMLDDKLFFRTHKSHLINLEHVKKYRRINGCLIEMCDGSEVDLSRRKKDSFLDFMAKNKC